MLRTIFIVLAWVILIRVLLFLGRLIWNGYKIHRFMRDPIGETQRRAQKEYRRQQAAYNEAPKPEPTHKKKKIGPEVGEYVSFTDIEVTETEVHQNGDTSTTEYHEQQITDVEWEDVE